MLRNFRQVFKSSRGPTGVVMGALALGMVAYLAPSGGFSGPESVAARVYGHEITRRELEKTIQLYQNQMGRQFPGMAPFIQAQSLNYLINQKLEQVLENEKGILVTDEEVRAVLEEQLRQNPTFVNEDKTLKPVAEIKELLLSRVGTTLGEIERSQRKDMVRQKLLRRLALSVPVDEARLEWENRVKNEKPGYEYLSLLPDASKVQDPSDQVLGDFLKASGSRFMVGPRRILQYVVLTKDNFKKELVLSDQDLKKAYQSRLSLYQKPAEVKARHILFRAAKDNPAEALGKAQALRAKLIQGGDFIAAAKEFSEDPGSKDNGGDLGFFPKEGRMVKEFGDAAFALKVGEISQPVKTQFGFHLIKVEEIKPAMLTPFEEVKESLSKLVADERFQQLAKEKLEKLRKTVGPKGDLTAAAKKQGLQVQLSSPLLQEPDAKIGDLAESQMIIGEAFRMEIGHVSSKPVRAGAALVLFRVKEELPSTVPPLADIKPKVLQAFKEEQARKDLLKRLEEARKNNSIASLGEIQKQPPTALSGLSELGKHPRVQQALLNTPVGEWTPAIWTHEGKLWVARIMEREAAPKLDFAKRQELLDEIQNAESQRQLQALLAFRNTEGRKRSGLSSFWGRWGGIWINPALQKAPTTDAEPEEE